MKNRQSSLKILLYSLLPLFLLLTVISAYWHYQPATFSFEQHDSEHASMPVGGEASAEIKTDVVELATTSEREREEAEKDSEEQQSETPEEEQVSQEREPSEPQPVTNEPQAHKTPPSQTSSIERPSTTSTQRPTDNEQVSSGIGGQQLVPTDEPAAQIQIVDEATTPNQYFTTNLRSGDVVTEAQYEMTITHVNDALAVNEVIVRVNDTIIESFTGTISLEEGLNTVSVQVVYEDEEPILVTQLYDITLNTTDVIITTTLVEDTLNTPTLHFTAQAQRDGEQQPLTVLVNEEPLEALAGNAYKATLQEGNNEIRLQAQNGDEMVEQLYNVEVHIPKSTIHLTTTLKDQRVNEAMLSFTAKAMMDEQNIPLQVRLNGETVEPQTSQNYDVTLQPGTNIITLEAAYEGEVLKQQYKVLYQDPTAPIEVPEKDPLAPIITTDLQSGSAIKGTIKTINVWPTTADGERIRGKNVLVRVNGVGVPFTWDDSSKTSYKLTLQDGENQVSIKAWDDAGRATTEQFTIHATAVEELEVIGQVTISVEGSTVGIPYFIEPTMDTNFYLQSISKQNMLAHVNIPDDLWALVAEHSSHASKTDYTLHRLSEFDFANGAGWMYSVNGDYPNYGLSDAYFLDGDVIRIRYTLHYGKDIKGYGGMGGDATGDWSKEW